MSRRIAGVPLSSDFKEAPYWRDDLPPVAIPPAALPATIDVLVVGAGFTGLAAALQLARGGRKVVVVDAGEPGHGCSTRNGGQVSSEMHVTTGKLGRRIGAAAAVELLRAGVAAHQFLGRFLAAEQIDCDYARCGHFIGAHTPGRLKDLEGFAEEQRRLGVDAILVPPGEQDRFIRTGDFHGGLSLPDWSSIHPGRYHHALLQRVLAAGATVVPGQRVGALDDDGRRVRVKVGAEAMQANDVVMATDGYADAAYPWLQRRIVSVPSVVLTTEPMDPAEVARCYPGGRMIYDTRKNVSYHRPTPDGRRILFGTVVPFRPTDPMASLPDARANLLRVFPDLARVRISHAWHGMVGATFDRLPHLGSRGRIHHAAGYNGTGIAMSSYLGTTLGRRLLGDPQATTSLDAQGFPAVPLYTGNAWFRTPLLYLHELQDRLPR